MRELAPSVSGGVDEPPDCCAEHDAATRCATPVGKRAVVCLSRARLHKSDCCESAERVQTKGCLFCRCVVVRVLKRLWLLIEPRESRARRFAMIRAAHDPSYEL